MKPTMRAARARPVNHHRDFAALFTLVLGAVAATSLGCSADGANAADASTETGPRGCYDDPSLSKPPDNYDVPFVVRCSDAVTSGASDGGGDAAAADAAHDASDASPDPTPRANDICGRSCNKYGSIERDSCVIDRDAQVVHCSHFFYCGRRFEGLGTDVLAATDDGASAMAAEAAHLEAASVHAFRWLAQELEAHSLPPALARRARAAARDEVRHARMMTRLARRLGNARVRRVEKPRAHVRSLRELAVENMVEGCVRETFGALVARYQSLHAADVSTRAAFASIARDETRHAALAWDIAAVVGGKLTPNERQCVADARDAAIADLERALGAAVSAAGGDVIGQPPPAVARALFANLRERLYA